MSAFNKLLDVFRRLAALSYLVFNFYAILFAYKTLLSSSVNFPVLLLVSIPVASVIYPFLRSFHLMLIVKIFYLVEVPTLVITVMYLLIQNTTSSLTCIYYGATIIMMFYSYYFIFTSPNCDTKPIPNTIMDNNDNHYSVGDKKLVTTIRTTMGSRTESPDQMEVDHQILQNQAIGNNSIPSSTSSTPSITSRSILSQSFPSLNTSFIHKPLKVLVLSTSIACFLYVCVLILYLAFFITPLVFSSLYCPQVHIAAIASPELFLFLIFGATAVIVPFVIFLFYIKIWCG